MTVCPYKTDTFFYLSQKTDLNAERVFWRDFFSNAMETAPRRIQNSAFVTSRSWALIDTESALTNSAWYGLVTSLVCSCVVVLIASGGSWRLAALASGSVGTVAVSFVAFLVSAGWTVGIEESVCITVLVGLSLDYVLHVAGAFVKAPALGLGRLDNTQRARWALRSTGKSVFMGERLSQSPHSASLIFALYGVQSESTDPTPSDPFPIPDIHMARETDTFGFYRTRRQHHRRGGVFFGVQMRRGFLSNLRGVRVVDHHGFFRGSHHGVPGERSAVGGTGVTDGVLGTGTAGVPSAGSSCGA